MVLDPMAASSPNSAENLLALLDASDVAVLRLDRSGRCTLLNRAAGALLGHPAEVLLGEPLHAVVHPHHAGRAAHEVPTCALERALLAGAALRADDRFQRADGSEIPVEYQINPITSDGRTTGLVVIVRDRGGRSDLDTRPTQSARLLTLRAELATAFSAAAGVDDLLQRCVGAFMRQLDIAFVRIWLYDPARQSLVLSASAGLPSRAEGDRGQVPWGAFTIGRIAEAREPYLTNDVGRESRSGADAWAAREGVVSFAGYPLIASQRLIGVLALFAREPIAEESLEELSRVAGAIAGGIEHRRTEGEQQRLVNQLQAQQARLRTMLQQMPSGILVADAPSGRITLGNDQVERILRHPIQYATSIADVHQERARRADGRVLAASEWPLARAIRGGEVTREEELEYLRGDGTRCWISVSAAPVRDADGRIVAGVEIIEDIDARRQSEERLRLLLRASELLARSLDYDQTLGEVARLVVPAVADWCFFDLVDDESAYRRVAAANADPSNAGLAARFRRGYGPLPEARHGISHVARSGRPELVVEVDDELLLSLARDEEQLAGMRALGLASFLSVPLIARGRTIGVLTLATAESGRRLSAADLPFAEDLGRRAAAAIDNARLTIESQRHVDRLNALLEVSRQVAEAELDPRQTLRVVAEQASRRIGDGCTIRLLDEEGTALETWASFHVDPAVRLRLQQATSRPLSPVGGLHGPVVQGGHALLTPVLQREHFAAVDNDYQAYAEFAGLHSLLIVPLRGRERVIGTLALTRERTRAPYDVEDQMLAQELADRAALAVDNARLYQAAQAAVTVREEFLSIAAHELKTPLTTVKGYAQMLRRQLDRGEPQPQVLEHSADSLLRQLARLENLVTDLLDVSRIQQGQLAFRPERCDLSEIAAQVLAHFEQAPELGADHQLTLDAPAAVAGTWDPARLDQVLTNLISNALKYSPNGGEVLVRVRPRGTGAEVSVRDQGLGIAPEQQPRLFQPFARLPAAILRDGEGVSGSGLGLYICRQIVERHGGTIVVESAPGVGSTFTVRLPR